MTHDFLVTGGAGSVGSHLVAALAEHGARVTVIDNLSTGHQAALPQAAAFIHGGGWRPAQDDLDDIVRTAFAWRQVHPAGYGD